MDLTYKQFLESGPVGISAPCRVDLGGTLDISTFYLPLRRLKPCTFNMAIDMRTRVRLSSYTDGRVKVSSRGFESADYPAGEAPFDHPLGLMFAIAAYFNAGGVHIEIDSASPPRAGLGGSSAAAVALVAGFCYIRQQMDATLPPSGETIAMIAHAVESSVAGVPCGFQDQLAAVFGGVNCWNWPGNLDESIFERQSVISRESIPRLNPSLVLAYCGIPHESKDINGTWVREFVSGRHREEWRDIIGCTHDFIGALGRWKLPEAVAAMNRETAIRRKMTPHVLDEMGETLVELAMEGKCGARFTGAGGGGCLWALGAPDDIDRLLPVWDNALSTREGARLLDADIDPDGLRME